MDVDVSEHLLARPPAPWDTSPHEIARWLSSVAPCDAMQLWLTRRDQPAADELLLSRGFSAQAIRSWIGSAGDSNSLTRRAVQDGVSEGSLGELGVDAAGIGRDGAVLVHAQRETLSAGRVWLSVFARAADGFSARERETLAATARWWEASFNRPAEEGLARLLVGHDHRMIHADPACRLLLLAQGVSPQRLIDQVRQIRDQRWPMGSDEAACDMAIEVGGGVSWIVCRGARAIDLPDALHWLLEVRPLAPGELPAVGVLADERIARALAYIHDHYHEGPSLAEIARQVHVSPFHFHRVFTRQVGVSPKHYLQMKQMQAARWRLRSQRTPIGQIARETGFSSHGHFTATFGRVVGSSPTAYRQRAGR